MSTDKRSPLHQIIVVFLLCLYKATYGLYIRLFYRLRCQNKNVIPRKGPYLLLANHSNNFDGLFLQCIIGRTISFVVTDAMFKKKTLGKLMSFVGYIPKRKHVTDSGAIRQIIRAVRQNGIVGIFPEGGRNWDGKTGDISTATFRLAKMLGVPVVTACIKGSYLSEPRWAETKRRGLVEIEFQIHFADGNVPGLDLVGRNISSALAHNEAVWQQTRQIPFKGKALIRGLERLLYICPTCKSTGTMVSSDDRLTCLKCAASYRLDAFGFLHAVNGSLPSKNIPDINDWQLKLLAERFLHTDSETVLLSDEGARLYCAKSQNSPFEPETEGTLRLTRGKLTVGSRLFHIERIQGVAVYFKTHLEFRYDGLDYRVGFAEKNVSAYKWNCALDALKNVTREN